VTAATDAALPGPGRRAEGEPRSRRLVRSPRDRQRPTACQHGPWRAERHTHQAGVRRQRCLDRRLPSAPGRPLPGHLRAGARAPPPQQRGDRQRAECVRCPPPGATGAIPVHGGLRAVR